MHEVVLFYNGLDVPTRQILDSRGAIPSKTATDAKIAIQEMAEYSQKWHNGTSRVRSTETSDGLAAIQAQLNNLGREIKKVNEKVYAAQVGCEQCKGPHYTKDCPLKEEGKTLEEAYYTQFGEPFQGGGYRATTPGFYQRNNANPSYQELLKKLTTCNLVDLFKEEDIEQHLQGASINVMPLLTYLNLGLGELAHTRLTVELADRTVKYPKEIAENVLVGIGKFTFPVDFIILDMLEDIKVPLIFERPFLSTARAKIDVYKRKITLRVREERIVFTSVKPASSLIKRVYMLSLRERMELDLEARLMEETLVNQEDDLIPSIEEGEVIEEFRARDDELDIGIDDYPSYCDYDKKIYINFLEDMYVYRDDGMGDVIFGEPFLREVGIKTKRFEGIITLYNSDDEVSEKDEKNGISHSYQKLKGFYKGV
ncbi:putative reverse transcriptase domain-containing protein [Tanacetum coccineum]|uniref:Reverse transcriptase domain-containing protein n=1 Tax=Tanacetum coccineum TaxID=301880 RepID=A0ABQ4YIY5_9ASTR